MYVVNILASNHLNNVRALINDFEKTPNLKIHFYCFFGKNDDNRTKLWYNTIEFEKLFGNDGDDISIKNGVTKEIRQKHNLEAFINDIRKIKNI